MKKSLIILIALMAVSAVFAFQPGSMMVGGQIDFGSYKANSDADAYTTIGFYPQLSGFVMENLSADLIVSYAQIGDDASEIGLGLGAKYFYNTLYGGLDFTYQINKFKILNQNKSGNSMYLTPKIGYMVPIIPNAYVDLQAYYKMGIGEYGGDQSGDNSSSHLNLRAGLLVNLGL